MIIIFIIHVKNRHDYLYIYIQKIKIYGDRIQPQFGSIVAEVTNMIFKRRLASAAFGNLAKYLCISLLLAWAHWVR